MALLAVALLLLPSFRQRSRDEPFTAVAVAVATVAPVEAAAPAAAPVPELLSRGRLSGIGHDASGTTALYDLDGSGVLRFEDVDIEGTPGPCVHLVPAGSREPQGGVLLGRLKAEKGSFSYQLPAQADARADWTVLIWCRQYDTPIAASDH